MTKLLVISSKKDLSDTIKYADGYLFGLKDYSVNIPLEITIEELKQINDICKQNSKDLFVAINKNIYNRELNELKQILNEIDKLNIKGIFYADTCLIQLKKQLNIRTSLVWSQEHLTTNYNTINLWYDFGAEYTYLSSEITLDEIKEIMVNSKAKLIVPIFGYLPMFTSKRHEVKNYLDNFKLSDNSKINYIEKEQKEYPITDNDEGSVVYSSNILNGYEEYKDINIDYVTLNSFNIENDTFIKVLQKYKEKNDDVVNLSNMDKGFLYKETVYKVK